MQALKTSTADPASSLTLLLNRWQRGDGRAFEQVIESTLAELHRMAVSRMRQGRDLTLSPTELLNESVARLLEGEADFRNRAHFFGVVSLHMRSILVDHARARLADKRGGGAVHVTLSEVQAGEESMALELLALDEALEELDAQDARAAQILHLTYFAGLSREAIAEVVDVSVPTVDRELRFARSWLAQRLDHPLEG
jgi:RNA polymerase sigma factor (TIGR02999 family)